ncbi:MAG TPA: hypothetical protein VF298_04045 [Bacteroidales bacterium]
MKKQFQFLVIILMITFIQSCVPEDSVTPDTGDVRDKYTGTWLVIEHARKSSLIVTYTIVISLDPSNSSQVLLSHFSGYSGSNPAYGIATSSSITVPSQSMASDWQVEGSGTLANSSTMDWTYTITAGGNTDTYTATATKQ